MVYNLVGINRVKGKSAKLKKSFDFCAIRLSCDFGERTEAIGSNIVEFTCNTDKLGAFLGIDDVTNLEDLEVVLGCPFEPVVEVYGSFPKVVGLKCLK